MKNRQNIERNDKKRSQSKNRLKPSTENIPKEKDLPPEQMKEFQRGSDFINSLIHEYLLKRDYLKSLDIFQEEISTKIKSRVYYSARFPDVINESTIETFFNQGKKLEFFRLWNRLIPCHIKAKELSIEKLEFFLHIYFSVYPLLPSVIGDKKNIKENNLKEIKLRMNEFKLYLESKEVEMSKTTEYLAYYALPYVQNPREHPTYKQIFTNDWVKELKEKLRSCLLSFVPTGKYPLLYDMFVTCEAANQNSNDNKINKNKSLFTFLDQMNKNFDIQNQNVSNHSINQNLSDNNINVNNINLGQQHQRNSSSTDNKLLLEDYTRLKKKEEAAKLTLIESQKKWTNFSLDLLGISFDLISNVQKIKNGVDVPDQYIEAMSNKLLKYENFLKKNAEDLERNTSFNRGVQLGDNSQNIDNSALIDKSHLNQDKSNSHSMLHDNSINNNNRSVTVINQSIHINYDPNFLLDMHSIRSLFSKVNAYGYDNQDYYDKVNFLMREIRLRISRRKHQKLKQMTLVALVINDILGLRSKHVKIFSNLLGNKNTVLETLKLMNTITNENRGRTYMLSKPSIIEEIVNIIFKEETDSEIRQNCLGIIQKFTLRSEPQKKLIELDVIAWITNVFIKECENISEYTLEYGLALLMNLSLRVTGRDRCEKVSNKLLKILINYLHSESIQVRTCINGTLYSLLKRKKMKLEAKKLGLEKMLNSQLQNPNEQMKKQIQYILEELNSDQDAEENKDEEFEDEVLGDDEEEVYDEEYVRKYIINIKKF